MRLLLVLTACSTSERPPDPVPAMSTAEATIPANVAALPGTIYFTADDAYFAVARGALARVDRFPAHPPAIEERDDHGAVHLYIDGARVTDRADVARDERQGVRRGNQVAYVVSRGARHHVWIRDLATHRELDLTPEGTLDDAPVISPDGKWVAVARTRGHDIDLWALPVDGAEPVRITTARSVDRPISWE